MDKGAWQVTVHGVAKSRTRLSDFTIFTTTTSVLLKTQSDGITPLLEPCRDSLGKTLMLGKTEGRRRRGQQKMRWLDGIIDSMEVSFEQILGDSEG